MRLHKLPVNILVGGGFFLLSFLNLVFSTYLLIYERTITVIAWFLTSISMLIASLSMIFPVSKGLRIFLLLFATILFIISIFIFACQFLK